ncbi:MAG: mucoidy inhibitor MuiA family protein [Deltaproteobacteria bacterium]|nr:mucoidy inhibitor MuiA family protein [Deltaproteobacteria bacterium]
MKKALTTTLIIFVLSFALSRPAFAGPALVKSAITNVTLFNDKALVTRVGTVHIEPGMTRFFIKTDAFYINEDSATATVYGKGTVMGVRVTSTPEPETPQDKIRDLEKKLDNLKAQREIFSGRIEAEKKKGAFIDAIIDSSKGKAVCEMAAGKTPKPADLSGMLSFIGKTVEEVEKNISKIEGRIRTINKKITAVNKEISMLSSGGSRNTTGIEITFNSGKAQDIRMRASYITRQAGWSPVYRADISGSKTDFSLSLMARIVQKTGEDWDGVALTISNALFVPNGRLPEIAPWYVDVPRARAWRQKNLMMAAPAAMKKAKDSVYQEAKFSRAAARRTAVSREYDIAGQVTVRSRDEETYVPLFTKTMTGDFFRLCVPAQSPHAYLTCRAKADDELMPGPMRVFFDGRYAGAMRLGEKQAGKPFVIGLGEDRSIRIERKKRVDKLKETFFKKFERDTVVRDLAYRISIENTGDKAVKLLVLDHVPVSKTDRITVEDISFSPKPARKDENGKPGVMEWDLTAAPGETKTIDISFTISYPKDMPFYP